MDYSSLPDHYATLGISSTALLADIKRAYRAQALLHHPDKNPNQKAATAKFQKIAAAWETLSDESKRRIYDAKLAGSRPAGNTQRQQQKDPNPKPEPKPRAKPEDNAKKDQREKEASAEKRRAWLNWVEAMNRKIADTKRKVEKLRSEIEQLDKLDREHEQKLRAANSWLFWSRTVLTDEEIQNMEVEKLQRLATRRIKQTRLEEIAALLEEMVIEKEGKEAAENARLRFEEIQRRKKEKEAKEREEAEQRRAFEEILKKQREQEERARKEREAEAVRKAREAREAREARAREAQEAWEAWEAREREARAAREKEARAAREREAREREAREAREREERNRAAARETTRRKPPKKTQYKPCQPRDSSSCTHKSFWLKVNGRHYCRHCSRTFNKFAFKCPKCAETACGECMRTLKLTGTSSKFEHRNRGNFGGYYEESGWSDQDYDGGENYEKTGWSGQDYDGETFYWFD